MTENAFCFCSGGGVFQKEKLTFFLVFVLCFLDFLNSDLMDIMYTPKQQNKINTRFDHK